MVGDEEYASFVFGMKCITLHAKTTLFLFVNMKQEESKDYLAPVTRCVPLCLENALCGSPLPGGNEDIGYEDWD